jgi:hypothetical protein
VTHFDHIFVKNRTCSKKVLKISFRQFLPISLKNYRTKICPAAISTNVI